MKKILAMIAALAVMLAPGVGGAEVAFNSVNKGLALHLPLDQTHKTGALYSDLSAQGNHGTVVGPPTATTDRFGVADKALLFDGTSDYVDLGTDFIGTGAKTISAWINPTSFGDSNNGHILENTKILFWINSMTGNNLNFRSDGVTTVRSADNAINLSVWQHVLVTRDATGANTNLYVNGLLSGDANQNSGTPAAGTNVILGDNNAHTRYFDGSIADVRIYNRALTQTEVTELYNTSGPGNMIYSGS